MISYETRPFCALNLCALQGLEQQLQGGSFNFLATQEQTLDFFRLGSIRPLFLSVPLNYFGPPILAMCRSVSIWTYRSPSELLADCSEYRRLILERRF